MSALWTGTPTTIRLDDLDVICAVLDCEPSQLLIREPAKVAAHRAARAANGGEQPGTGDPDRPAAARSQPHPPAGVNPARPLPSGKNKPRACVACHQRVVAWTTPRVDYCYHACPADRSSHHRATRCGGTRRRPPATSTTAKDCASGATSRPRNASDACWDCLAWGVIRKHKWLCWRCHSWRTRFPRGTCRICRRTDLPVNPDQACSLCDRQMVIRLGLTLEEANAGGQQLYLANVAWPSTRVRPGNVRRHQRNPQQHRSQPVEFHPIDQTQPTLFPVPGDLKVAQAKSLLDAHQLPDPPHAQMAAYLEAAVLDHARRHGWPKSTMLRTQQSMRVLQLMQDSPGAILLASDAMLLQQIGLTAIPVIDVATATGVMVDDRQPYIDGYVDTTIAGLPAPMRAELREWFDVMLNGSTTPPRRQPA